MTWRENTSNDVELPPSSSAVALLMQTANASQEITSRLIALAFQAVARPEEAPALQALMVEMLAVQDRHEGDHLLAPLTQKEHSQPALPELLSPYGRHQPVSSRAVVIPLRPVTA